MSFWDGTQWVPAPPPNQPSQRTPWRDLAATLTMVAVGLAFLVPSATIQATNPTIVASPTTGAVGASVTVVGRDLPNKTRVQLTWDGSAASMPSATTSGNGGLRIRLRVPAAKVGRHTLAVVEVTPGSTSASESTTVAPLLATTVFDVADVTPGATTPAPTSAPTPRPDPTTNPTPTPTPVATPTTGPTSTPTPVATPTVNPTSAPTPVATPTANPTPTAVPTPTAPPPSTGKVVSFGTSGSGSQFLALLRDETVDAIELAGTYRLPYMVVNVNRTRPIEVRPAAGATVVFSGANVGPDPQFSFGFGGRTSNMTFTGITFDGFVLGQQGVIQTLDVRSMTFRNITVRNSRSNGSTARPYHSWAAYIAANASYHASDLTLDHWQVIASGRSMSAVSIDGGDHISVTNWTVRHAYFAIHVSPENTSISSLLLDTATIDDSGGPSWGYADVSVPMENAAGTFRDLHATNSGVLLNLGSPRMTSGGGNSGL
jgi:hypothetical protein